MATYNIIMPKLGESVEEATITKWFVGLGDLIEEDQPIVELATDKVDSEIPSPVEGKVIKLNYEEGAIVAVGEVIAVISLDGDGETETAVDNSSQAAGTEAKTEDKSTVGRDNVSKRFYTPLVKTIARKENVSIKELDSILGSGANGRVNKSDILGYIAHRSVEEDVVVSKISKTEKPAVKITVNEGDRIVPMARMRKLTADHMIMSQETSAHVTSVIEADVTNIVKWRTSHKDEFLDKYGQKLTYMPIFTEAIARALKDFPQLNASTDGENIIYRKRVNIGIAVALPDWNLIVPVIKDADYKNMYGLATDINTLAAKARNNKLSPDDVSGGTFSITNFGSFNNLMGTPIINQPQLAIIATGAIVKKPSVLETPEGDFMAIRNKMYLSLSYDHRIVDGALGGAFLQRVAKYLEDFNLNRSI
ncbi:MAG: 2-oxo acid dehydrogenase subunit E2 [Chlorobi bacterium]|nr:2-oxo acid dehydrogenase subunit E2 [Chlorobiota bacterium]